MKIFDAVQYGKPVIISDVYGLTEVLSEQEAFIYKNSLPDGLFNMCKYVYMHPEEMDEKHENAVKRIEKWPSWDDIHRRQNEMFKRCCKL